MTILKTKDFLDTLKEILFSIAQDKKSAAVEFNQELNKKIDNLKDFPFMCRVSIYFDDNNIRDLIYKGYVIPYEVNLETKTITIIGITKYKNSL